MQEAIVALVVLAAAAYSAWSLMPRAWRSALRRRIAPGSAAVEAGACSACNDCGACGSEAGNASAPSARADAVRTVQLVRRPPTEPPRH